MTVFSGALSLLLTATGMYGLLAYRLAQRRRELGIRMALGATSFDLARTILRETLVLGTASVGCGAKMAWWVSAMFAARLSGVSARDPVITADPVHRRRAGRRLRAFRTPGRSAAPHWQRSATIVEISLTATRPFSIGLYLVIVFAFSWPFQLAFVVLGDRFRPLLLLSMIMAGVATFIAGRYVFKDGFDDAGWRWGRAGQYLLAFGLALFLWLVPVVIENVSGLRTEVWEPRWTAMLVTFMTSFSITLAPAFGEEFSWRGYLLPRLSTRFTTPKALLVHGFITWLWHVPVIVAIGLQLEGPPEVAVPLALAVSVIPTVLHAVVFAWLWSTSGSLLVATVYHSAFDEVRDTLQQAIGFGPLAENWQAVVLTLLGAVLLWKVR